MRFYGDDRISECLINGSEIGVFLTRTDDDNKQAACGHSEPAGVGFRRNQLISIKKLLAMFRNSPVKSSPRSILSPVCATFTIAVA